MNSRAITKPQYRIVILSGPEKGTAYQLVSEEVSIGRESGNDIAVPSDSRMSRHHAQIRINDNSLEIVDLSQKNQITINQKKIDRARLSEGMTFTVGTTEMRVERLGEVPLEEEQEPIQIEERHVAPTVVHMRPPAPPPRPPSSLGAPPRPSAPPMRTGGPKRNPVVTFVIVGVVATGLYLFLSDSPQSKGSFKIRGPEEVESTIQESERAKEELRKKVERRGDTYQEAQGLYIQGFRDYKKGQYSRALEAFRGALAVSPDHQLAQRYLKMAKRRLDELIQFNMIQGRQFRARQMYDKCSAAFGNVLNLSSEPNSPPYKEAKQLKEECDLYAQGRY